MHALETYINFSTQVYIIKSRISCSYRITFFQCLIDIYHISLSRTFLNIARLFETRIAFCRCHSPPARSSRNEEKLLSKSWTTHTPSRVRQVARALPRSSALIQFMWWITRRAQNNEHRRERLFEPFLLFMSVSFRYATFPSWNKDRRSPITDKTTCDTQNGKIIIKLIKIHTLRIR